MDAQGQHGQISLNVLGNTPNVIRRRSPRVVVVHDYLTQRGGAERFVLAMLRAFPGAPLVTSVYNPSDTFEQFREHDIRTTWLQHAPGIRRDPRLALPVLHRAFSGCRLPDADVVICSSSGWAHGVRTQAPKIVYCHNPPRWLHQSSDYAAGQALPARLGLEVIRNRLTQWDRSAAADAALYLANSTAVQHRVMSTYGIEARIVPPPFGVDPGGTQEPVAGVEPGFLLAVSRARGYKNSALLAGAVETMPDIRLFMVGGLPQRPDGSPWPGHMLGGRNLSDAQLRWLYAHCLGLVAVSHEDFGLTPLEANAFGKPVACLRAGGYLDTVRAGLNGVFIEGLSTTRIQLGIRRLLATEFSADTIKRHADGFSERVFAGRLRQAVDEVLHGATTTTESFMSLNQAVDVRR